MKNHSSPVSTAAFTSISSKSTNNRFINNYSFDDDESIDDLLRKNDILHPPPAIQKLNSRSRSQQQQHAVIARKASNTAEWNDTDQHFDNSQITTALPPALLKLDQQHAIPTLRHCNDILIEIEACTVEPRRCMIRSGVRGGDGGSRKKRQGNERHHHQQQQQLLEVVTTSVDCIGRVVQVAETDTHFTRTQQQKIHHDIQINDRIAAIHPFEYKLDKKNRLLLSRQHTHNNNSHSSSSNHQRYTLVDAGHVVKLPQNTNAAASACMTRVYTTAFQSLQLGLISPKSVMSSYLSNHRYSRNQLRGKSILIQHGLSELGRAWIQLSKALGATLIYATGSTSEELAVLRDELHVIPLGSDSFGFELCRQEKLHLVLIQDFPSCHEFDMYFSVMDDTRGVLVYCPRDDGGGGESAEGSGNGNENEKEMFGDLGHLGCSGSGTIPSLQDLANRARDVAAMAKFSLRLTCSPQFVTYRGIWASCKKDQGLYRKDLSFLIKLLEEGKLKPHVEECVSPEDIPSVQNRIELEGKWGTVVCLPAPLYEKKAVNVVSPLNSPSPESENARHFSGSKWNEDVDDEIVMDAERYAADSGYIVSPYKQPSIEVATADDTCNDNDLCDFRSMNITGDQPSPFRPRLLLSNSSDSLKIEPTQSFPTSTFESVSSVSVKAHEFLRDYKLLGRK